MRQARTKHAHRQMAHLALVLGIGAATTTLAYHIFRARFAVVNPMMESYSRDPALTVETYYRLIAHWYNTHSPIFQFTCPERYRAEIFDYCGRLKLTVMTRAADSLLYQNQITFLVSKDTTLSQRI